MSHASPIGGCRGVLLPTVRIGAMRYTSPHALRAFSPALSQETTDANRRDSAELDPRLEVARARAAAHGLRPYTGGGEPSSRGRRRRRQPGGFAAPDARECRANALDCPSISCPAQPDPSRLDQLGTGLSSGDKLPASEAPRVPTDPASDSENRGRSVLAPLGENGRPRQQHRPRRRRQRTRVTACRSTTSAKHVRCVRCGHALMFVQGPTRRTTPHGTIMLTILESA